MLPSARKPWIRRYHRIRQRCRKEAFGLAIITATLMILILVGGTMRYVNKAHKPHVAPEATYKAWATAVYPHMQKIAASNPRTTAGCTAVLPELWALQAMPLPPVDPIDWSQWIRDSESAMASCAAGDTRGMLIETGRVGEDTINWTAAVHAAYPDLGAP